MKYLNRTFVMLLFVMFALAGGGMAMAQDSGDKAKAEVKEKDAAQKQDRVVEKLRNDNPYLDKLHSASVEFIKDVPDEGVKTLYQIREAYGIIRSIHQVKKDVGHAVELCGKDNPDLKDDMNARFDEWKKLVDPAVAEEEGKLNAAIKKQSYKDDKVVHDYLKNIDAAAEYANKMLDKHVVTTPEACEGLRNSMDKTGPNIVTLLGQIEMPQLDDDGKTVVEDDQTDDKDVIEKEESSE